MESVETNSVENVVQFHKTRKRKKISRYLCRVETVGDKWNAYYIESTDELDIDAPIDSVVSGDCIYPQNDEYGNLLYAIRELLEWIVPSSQYSQKQIRILSQNPYVSTFVNEWSRTTRWREDDRVPYGEYAKILESYRRDNCEITAFTHF